MKMGGISKMKNSFKVMSKTALAAAFASAAIAVPVVAFAETPAQAEVVSYAYFEVNGNIYKVSLDDYAEYMAWGNEELDNLIGSSLIASVVVNDRLISLDDYAEYAAWGDTSLEEIPEVEYNNVQTVVVDEDGNVTTEPEASEFFEVTNISAINETSVNVTFPSEAGITEDDLVDQTITLTAGDAELTATYAAASLNEDGEATFSLSEGSSLVDATTYTVTGNILKGSTDFVAEVVDAYAKTFEASTTAIAAADTSKVFFSAKDQYGKDIVLEAATTAKDLKVSATVNGVPLTATEAKFAADYKSVEIIKALKENDVLKVTVSNTANEVVYDESFEYTVGEVETATATSFGALTAKFVDKSGKATESLSATDSATLTVPVLNQFGNPMELEAADKPVRWVVTKGKDLITTTDGDKAVTDAKGEFKFTANNPGEVVIDAYLANGKTVQFSKVIGAEKLGSIKVVTTGSEALSKTKYNNEEIVVAVLEATPTSALLNKEDIKLDVKPGKDLTADDITTSVDTVTVGKGDAAKEVIVVKATTTKAGSYTVTPYIGEAVDAEGVIKGTDITFTTTLNPTVASFEVAPVKENEVTVSETAVIKELTFKNKYDEVIKVPASKVTVASSDDSVATAVKTEKEGNAQLSITGKAEGTATVTVVSGAVSKQVTFDVVGAAELDKVSLGQAITNGVFAETNKEVVQVVTMKDQFGNDFIPADDKLADTVIASDVDELAADLQYYKINENTGDKELQGINQDPDTVGVVLVVNAKNVTLAEANTAETAKVTATVGGKEVSTVNVTVQPKAVIDKVVATPATTKVATGSTTKVTIVPTNQYGDVVQDLEETAFTINDQEVSDVKVVKEDSTKPDSKTVGYEVNYTAPNTVGTDSVEFKVTTTDGEKSAEVEFDVVAAGEVIDSVEIKEVTGLQNAGTETGVKLEAIVKDEDGKELSVKDTDLTWTITGVKDAEGNTLDVTKEGNDYIVSYKVDGDAKKAKLSIENGVLKSSIEKDGNDGNDEVTHALNGFTIDVAVQVESVNFETATTTVTIDDKAPEYKSGFKVDKVYVGTDATITDEEKISELEGTTVEITDVETKSVTLTFTGVDQYGEEFPKITGVTAKASSGSLEVNESDETTTNEVTDTVTITAVDGKNGKVFIQYDTERLTLDVVLSEEVAEAAALEAAVLAFAEKLENNFDELENVSEIANNINFAERKIDSSNLSGLLEGLAGTGGFEALENSGVKSIKLNGGQSVALNYNDPSKTKTNLVAAVVTIIGEEDAEDVSLVTALTFVDAEGTEVTFDVSSK